MSRFKKAERPRILLLGKRFRISVAAKGGEKNQIQENTKILLYLRKDTKLETKISYFSGNE